MIELTDVIDLPQELLLASMIAQFSHPVLTPVLEEVRRFESVLPMFATEVALTRPGQLEVSSRRPLGVVTVLALPSTRIEMYARHLAAALLTGNRVLLSPLSGGQQAVAEAMDRARTGAVRFAGADPLPEPEAAGGPLAMLEHGVFHIDNLRRDDEDAADPRRWLCERYSRFVVEIVAVRASYQPPPKQRAATRHRDPMPVPDLMRCAS